MSSIPVVPTPSCKNKTLEFQVSRTYDKLRILVAVIAFTLPASLWIGGKIHGISLRPSMSDYYWATPTYSSPPCKTGVVDKCTKLPIDIFQAQSGTMRNCFVGFLFAISAILIIYRGYTTFEDLLLSFAGLMAFCIAIFPMDWACSSGDFDKHGVSAGLFFAAIAIDCIFCSRNTVGLLDSSKQRQWFYATYGLLSASMIVFPFIAWRLTIALHRTTAIYWIEVCGIYAFATYWVVKTVELHFIGSEKRAIEERRVSRQEKAD